MAVISEPSWAASFAACLRRAPLAMPPRPVKFVAAKKLSAPSHRPVLTLSAVEACEWPIR
ncbi:hypothetical protein D3C87_2099090 [compost metagenome]